MRWWFPVVLLLVAGGAAALGLPTMLEQRAAREQVRRGQVLQNVTALNEALLMYLTDFEAFPPSAELATVKPLLVPYVAEVAAFNWPGSSRPLPVQFLYRPGQTKAEVRRLASTQPALLHDLVVPYNRASNIVGHLDRKVEFEARK